MTKYLLSVHSVEGEVAAPMTDGDRQVLGAGGDRGHGEVEDVRRGPVAAGRPAGHELQAGREHGGTARLHAAAAVAFPVTCLVMAATTIHWLARPHLFTWLLVAVFCWVIERARRTGSGKLLLVLPVLMLFWVNLHPGFLAGLLILAVWCATAAVRRRVPGTAEERVAHGRRWAHWLALTGFACLVATFANPYRIELHRHIVSYLFSPTSVTATVAEWTAPDFHNPRLHWFELLLPLGGAAGLLHGLRRRLAWCALTLGWMHLALSSVRNVPIFAIVCAAPVAGLLDHLIRQCGFQQHCRGNTQRRPTCNRGHEMRQDMAEEDTEGAGANAALGGDIFAFS